MLRETVKELRKNYPYYCPHCRENIKFETLKRLNENNISLERMVDIMRYYDIHVNYDGTKDGAGYSIFVKANVSSEDEVLQYAINNHLFEEDGDEKYVDYVEEIDEEDYHDATGE